MLKLLGEYLRADCGLTCHQIVLGLRQQVIMRDAGLRAPLGEMLVALGFVTEEQLDFALAQQQYDREVAAQPAPLHASDPVYFS